MVLVVLIIMHCVFTANDMLKWRDRHLKLNVLLALFRVHWKMMFDCRLHKPVSTDMSCEVVVRLMISCLHQQFLGRIWLIPQWHESKCSVIQSSKCASRLSLKLLTGGVKTPPPYNILPFHPELPDSCARYTAILKFQKGSGVAINQIGKAIALSSELQ